jgi:predicted benzoate:H+ symporter BenE
VWIGVWTVDVCPSPKFQSHEAASVDRSLNCAVNGAIPVVMGYASKFAVGWLAAAAHDGRTMADIRMKIQAKEKDRACK